MKKTVYYISIIVALLLSTNVMAGPVSSQDAKQKAAAFLQKQAQQTKNARRAAALRAPQLAEAQAFGEALHRGDPRLCRRWFFRLEQHARQHAFRASNVCRPDQITRK